MIQFPDHGSHFQELSLSALAEGRNESRDNPNNNGHHRNYHPELMILTTTSISLVLMLS